MYYCAASVASEHAGCSSITLADARGHCGTLADTVLRCIVLLYALQDFEKNKLDSSNLGFQLLQKAGWKEGQGLGKQSEGAAAPGICYASATVTACHSSHLYGQEPNVAEHHV